MVAAVEATAAEAAVVTLVVAAEATTGAADRVAEARIAEDTAALMAALDRTAATDRMAAADRMAAMGLLAALRARGVREHRTPGTRIVMDRVRLARVRVASIRRVQGHRALESLTDSSTRLAEPTRQRWLRPHMQGQWDQSRTLALREMAGGEDLEETAGAEDTAATAGAVAGVVGAAAAGA